MLLVSIPMIFISPDSMLLADKLKGMKPVTAKDFRPIQENRAKLGRLLFYDNILSGNLNISCGTCHHHNLMRKRLKRFNAHT
jgi:cytochrome c peroxidase